MELNTVRGTDTTISATLSAALKALQCNIQKKGSVYLASLKLEKYRQEQWESFNEPYVQLRRIVDFSEPNEHCIDSQLIARIIRVVWNLVAIGENYGRCHQYCR